MTGLQIHKQTCFILFDIIFHDDNFVTVKGHVEVIFFDGLYNGQCVAAVSALTAVKAVSNNLCRTDYKGRRLHAETVSLFIVVQ